jgi:hypothetical protein
MRCFVKRENAPISDYNGGYYTSILDISQGQLADQFSEQRVSNTDDGSGRVLHITSEAQTKKSIVRI